MSGSRGDYGEPGTLPLWSLNCPGPLPHRFHRRKLCLSTCHIYGSRAERETGSNVGPRLPRTRRSNHVRSLLQWGSGEMLKGKISHWSRTDMVLRTEKYLLTVSNIPVACMKGPVCLGKSKRVLKPGYASDKPRSSGSPTHLPNENLREMA